MNKDWKQRDKLRLDHILEAISEIENIVNSNDRSKIVELALERLIQTVGEACRNVSDNLRNKYPQIPWRDIIGMRNILVHEYYKIKSETVWDVAEHKIPALKNWVEGILEESDNEQT